MSAITERIRHVSTRIDNINASYGSIPGNIREVKRRAGLPHTPSLTELAQQEESLTFGIADPKLDRYARHIQFGRAIWESLLTYGQISFESHHDGMRMRLQVEDYRGDTTAIPQFDPHHISASTDRLKEIVRGELNRYIVEITKSALGIGIHTQRQDALIMAQMRESNFFKYIVDTIGGGNEGAQLVALAASAALEPNSETGALVRPDQLGGLLEQTTRLVMRFAHLNLFPQKVFDFLASEGINPFVKNEHGEVVARDDILDIIESFGRNVFTNPELQNLPADDEGIFAAVLHEISHVQPTDLQPQQVPNDIVIEFYNALRELIDFGTDINLSPFERVSALIETLEQHTIEPAPAYRHAKEAIQQRILLSLKIMKVFYEYKVDTLNHETLGCPFHLGGEMGNWMTMYRRILTQWYQHEYARLTSDDQSL